MTDSRCPDEEILIAYVQGHIDDNELAGIANHLIDCERCYATVATKARSLASRGQTANIAPPFALLPALLTGAVIALILTVSLRLLLW